MEVLSRAVGPLATNVHIVADPASREAIAIDTATPCLDHVAGDLLARGWRLRLIVSSHGHWDHIGDNAPLQAWSREQLTHLAEHGHLVGGMGQWSAKEWGTAGAGEEAEAADEDAEAAIACHPLDRDRLIHPQPLFAPFEIPPSVPAVELAEGGRVRVGAVDLEVLHTPGHTEGSVCLYAADDGLLFSGDTLFRAGWGRTDLPGGSAEAMAESLARLAGLPDHVRVLPGHGPSTTIGAERALLELVRERGRLPL